MGWRRGVRDGGQRGLTEEGTLELGPEGSRRGQAMWTQGGDCSRQERLQVQRPWGRRKCDVRGRSGVRGRAWRR